MGLHALDAAFHDLAGLHAQHLEAFLDDLPVAASGKALVLEFLLQGLYLHAVKSFRAHEGVGLDDACELIHGERLFSRSLSGAFSSVTSP